MSSKKKNRIYLNGADCIMQAFDYRMRQAGAAGNMGQIILGLSSRFSADILRNQIAVAKKRFPIINGVLKRGWLNQLPYWDINITETSDYPAVFEHECNESSGQQYIEALERNILNQPMNIRKGELIRFDLLYIGENSMKVIMTWSHLLMDAHGAESFLAIVGGGLSAEKALNSHYQMMSGSYKKRWFASPSSPPTWKDAAKSFKRIDDIASTPPISLYTKFNHQISSRQDYRIVSFDLDETELIYGLAEKTCGFLNESAYFISCVMREFHQLCVAKGLHTPAYVVPLSIDLRKKGTRMPVFSNQMATLLYVFRPDELDCRQSTIESFKKQTLEAFNNNLIYSYLCALEFSRVLPSWLYARKLRQALNGEIASIVVANPGKSFSQLFEFMDIPVDYQQHVPTIVIPPGIGVVFYTYSGKLYITLAYLEGMISPQEADDFVNNICLNLLDRK